MTKHAISEDDRRAFLAWKAATRISNREIGEIAGVTKISVAKWINGQSYTMKAKAYNALESYLKKYMDPDLSYTVEVRYNAQFKAQVLAKLFGHEDRVQKLSVIFSRFCPDPLSAADLSLLLRDGESLDPVVVCLLICFLGLDTEELNLDYKEKKLLYGVEFLKGWSQ